VTIEFEWQRRVAVHVPAVDDCICPKELAVRLISALLWRRHGRSDKDTSCLPNPQGPASPSRELNCTGVIVRKGCTLR
jgi:hypothetical protein